MIWKDFLYSALLAHHIKRSEPSTAPAAPLMNVVLPQPLLQKLLDRVQELEGQLRDMTKLAEQLSGQAEKFKGQAVYLHGLAKDAMMQKKHLLMALGDVVRSNGSDDFMKVQHHPFKQEPCIYTHINEGMRTLEMYEANDLH